MNPNLLYLLKYDLIYLNIHFFLKNIKDCALYLRKISYQ